jgi:shikimate kinase
LRVAQRRSSPPAAACRRTRTSQQPEKSHALVVCLWASPEKIWERVKNQSHRPLLHDADPQAKIRELLAAREPFYKQADVLLNTELRSVREVAQQIVHQFRLATSSR